MVVNEGQVDKAPDCPPQQLGGTRALLGCLNLWEGLGPSPPPEVLQPKSVCPCFLEVLPSCGCRVDCVSGPEVPQRRQCVWAPWARSPHCHLRAGRRLAGTPSPQKRVRPSQSAGRSSWPDLGTADSRQVPISLPLYLAS